PAPREDRPVAPDRSGFRFPGPQDRVTINGMTGSGKSTFALWLFAECADYNKKPWILVDFKGEHIISHIVTEKLAEIISIRDAIPKQPGVYVVRPDPRKDGMALVTDF